MLKLQLVFLKRPLQTAVFFWGFLFLFALTLFLYGVHSVELHWFSIYVCLMASLISILQTAHSRVPQFLRRVSSSINGFWTNYLMTCFAIIGINVLFLILFRISYSVSSMDFTEISIWDMAWMLFCFTLFSINMSNALDPMKAKENINKPAKNLLKFLFLYVFAGIEYYLLLEIRILAYLIFALVFWTMFIRSNPFFKNSFHLAKRNRIRNTGFAFILAFSFLSYGVEMFLTRNAISSDYLGIAKYFTQEKPKADARKVNSSDDWFNWYSHRAKNLSADDVIKALVQLEEFCPSSYSDTPIRIECSSAEERRAKLFSEVWPESDIQKFLESKSYYANLVGLVEFRKLKQPVSDGLKLIAEKFAKEPGNLSPIALKTLSGAKGQPNDSVQLVLLGTAKN